MGNWVLLGELAKMSQVSDSTARRYANIFKDYLHSKSFGRITKYQPESAAIFRRVAELYQEGRNTIEILDLLPQEFPRLSENEATIPPEGATEAWERPGKPPEPGLLDELREALAAQGESLQNLTALWALRLQEIEQSAATQEEQLQRVFALMTSHSQEIKAFGVTQTEKFQALSDLLERQNREMEKRLAAQTEKTQGLFQRLEQQGQTLQELKELIATKPKEGDEGKKQREEKKQYIENLGKTNGERDKSLLEPAGQRTEFNNKTGALTTEGSRFKLEERIIPEESRVPREGPLAAPAGYPARLEAAPTENERLALYLRERKNPGEAREAASGWKFWENWKSRGKRKRK